MCPRPVQTQARQNTNMECGGGHEVPLLTKVLYVADILYITVQRSVSFRSAVLSV